MVKKQKKINYMCTAFRDGFQSVYGARVLTKDFLPAVEAAKDAGISYFEAGGGARFQALYFYCNENAFDMMDAFREAAGPDANLQTLSRGVNVVGLDSQSSDVIKAHADLFKKHGMTTIRNFDALNDVNNLIYSGQCIHQAGLKHQVVVTMMELPPGCEGAHDAAFYEDVLKKILDADIPYDSVCFKDASGTAVPSKVHETIKGARKLLGKDVPIHFHTHETAGIGLAGHLAAIEAGADAVDLSMAPVSGGSCQTDIVTMWHALRGSDYTLDIDIDKILEAEEVFKDCMSDYFIPPEAQRVEPIIPWSPMPGGALTANTQMLRDNGILDKYPEISKAMGECVRRGGFGTSVTPVSQFYFQQAFNNVMFGPWEKIAEGYGKMVLGYFGKTPVEPDPEIVKLAAEQMGLEPTTKTPLEINDADPSKGLEAARKILKDEELAETDENLFIVATCQDKGVTFLKGEATENIRYAKDEQGASEKADSYAVTVDGQTFNIALKENGTAEVDGQIYAVDIGAGDAVPVADPADAGAATIVKASMPGTVVNVVASGGQTVQAGDVLLVLEAMKMEVEIKAPVSGLVQAMYVSKGEQVPADKPLAAIAERRG